MSERRNDTPPASISSPGGRICHEAIMQANQQIATRLRSSGVVAKEIVEQLATEAAELREQSAVARTEFFNGVAHNLAGQAGARELVGVAIKLLPTVENDEEKLRLQAGLAALLTSVADDPPYSASWGKMREAMSNNLSEEELKEYEQSPLAEFAPRDFSNLGFAGIVLGLDEEFEQWKRIVSASTREPQELSETEIAWKQRLQQAAEKEKERVI